MTQVPIIITRNLKAGQRTAIELRSLGLSRHRMILSPLVEIRFITPKLNLGRFRSAIFTSQNAARAASPPPAGMLAWCIGEKTADIARKKGFMVITAKGNAESLISLLKESPLKHPMVWLRGRHTAVDIQRRLFETGIQIQSEIVYEQQALCLSEAALENLQVQPCILPVFSPKTAAILSREAEGLVNPGHLVCCLGYRTAEACRLSWQKEMADDAESLIQMTVNRSLQSERFLHWRADIDSSHVIKT